MGELAAHPQNWRRHPEAQRKTMQAAADEVGLISPLVENMRSEAAGWPAGSTPTLIDGHLRLELALERGESQLPVVVVDLTEREEALALASLDPIGAQAEADPELLAALLEVAPPESPDLAALLKGIVDYGECLAWRDDEPGDSGGSSPWGRIGSSEDVTCQIGALAIRLSIDDIKTLERWAENTDGWELLLRNAIVEICNN